MLHTSRDPIRIRRLQRSDVEDVRTIRLAALKTEPASFGSVHAIEASRPMSHFEERIAASTLFGAFGGDRIVGMIGFTQETGPKDAHRAFVWGFYVEPAWRGLGVGAALMDALIEAAQELVEQLTLSVVRENKAAIRLYERSGFAVYGIAPQSLKQATGYSDEVLMMRPLQAPV